MFDNRSSLPTPQRPLAANAGVSIRYDAADGLLVQPLTPVGDGLPPFACQPPFPLPRLPSGLLERTAGTARAFWRRYQRSLAILLYVDLRAKNWVAMVPAQFSAQADGRFNADFANLQPPGEELRLAGSLRCLPCPGLEDAAAAAPTFEGLHVVVDPCRDWLSARGFLRIASRLHPAGLDQVVFDECDACVDALLDRVWLVDRLG